MHARLGPHVEPARGQAAPGEPLTDIGGTDSKIEGDSNGAAGIGHVVLAGELEGVLLCADPEPVACLHAPGCRDQLQGEIRPDGSIGPQLAIETGSKLLVAWSGRVQIGTTRGIQALEDLGLGLDNSAETLQPLEMSRSHCGDDDPLRPDPLREIGELSFARGAHLDHQVLGIFISLE